MTKNVKKAADDMLSFEPQQKLDPGPDLTRASLRRSLDSLKQDSLDLDSELSASRRLSSYRRSPELQGSRQLERPLRSELSDNLYSRRARRLADEENSTQSPSASWPHSRLDLQSASLESSSRLSSTPRTDGLHSPSAATNAASRNAARLNRVPQLPVEQLFEEEEAAKRIGSGRMAAWAAAAMVVLCLAGAGAYWWWSRELQQIAAPEAAPLSEPVAPSAKPAIGAALPQTAGEEPTVTASKTFDKWGFYCVRPPGGATADKACYVLSNLVVRNPQSQEAMLAAIIVFGRRTTGSGVQALIRLPIPVQLSSSPILGDAAGNPIAELKWTECQQQMCSSNTALMETHLEHLRNIPDSISVTYVNRAGQTLRVNGSAKGLKEALGALAAEN